MRWEHVSIPSTIGTETDQEDHGEGNETDSEQGVDEVDAETRVVESWGSGQW